MAPDASMQGQHAAGAAATKSTVSINVNGQPLQASAEPHSLLEFLRGHGCKSVKSACGEGGCGACAVLITTQGPDGKAQTRSVNSCLMPMYMADGAAVTTADGLPLNAEGKQPVAERLAGFFASQCGFCTPGMAVACHAALTKAAAAGQQPTGQHMRDALDGNLCRCTGYRPIVDVCKSFAGDVDIEDLGFNMFTSSGQPLPPPATTTTCCHPPPAPATTNGSSGAAAATGSVPPTSTTPDGELAVLQLGSQQRVYVAHSLQQLRQAAQQAAAQGGSIRLVAGNTGPGVYKDWPWQEHLLLTKQVSELQGVKVVMTPGGAAVRVGAAASLSDVVDALTAWANQPADNKQQLAGADKLAAGEDAVLGVPGVWSEMASHLRRVAGSHVRSAATLVGNLVLAGSKGLPSDVATLLLAANASVEVTDLMQEGSEEAAILPLSQYVQQQKQLHAGSTTAANGASTTSAAGEGKEGVPLLLSALIPVPPVGSRMWSSRVAARYANAAAVINAAALWPTAAANLSAVTPTFVLGMNLEHTAGPEKWVVSVCEATQQVLQQAAAAGSAGSGCGLSSQLVQAALTALTQEDLPRLFGLPATSDTAVGTTEGDVDVKRQQHLAYLRSAAEGLLLQALSGLLGVQQQQASSSPAGSGELSHSVLDAAALLSHTRLPGGREGSPASHNGNGGSPTAAAVAAGLVHLTAASPAVTGQPDSPTQHDGVEQAGNRHQTTSQTMMMADSPVPSLLAAKLPAPGVVSGKQQLQQQDASLAPITYSLPKESAKLQARGTAQYADDVPLLPGALYAAWVTASVASGRVVGVDTSQALEVPGAVRFIGPEDVPVPEVGPLDEPLFATEVAYYGQPLGLMLGSSYQAAQRAAQLVRVSYEQPDTPALLSADQALAAGSVWDLMPFVGLMSDVKPGAIKGSIRLGAEDVASPLASSPVQLRGIKFHLPSQTHMYMEPQTAVAEVEEDGAVRVHSATQNFDQVLLTVAAALGLPHSKVEVKLRRVGGGFGGKSLFSDRVAAAAAVAAVATGKQVRLATNRNSDLLMFGGRCEVDVAADIGCDQEGHITALDLDCKLYGGAFIGLAWIDAQLMAEMLDNVYDLPAVRAQYTLLRLNLPQRTSVRSPGTFEGLLAMEQVVEVVAAHLGLPPALVRERNMRKLPNTPDAQVMNSVGQPICTPEQYTLPRIWQELKANTRYDERLRAVEQFNAAHTWRKRGLSLVPCQFPLPAMGKSAIVHIYTDGSIRVAHAGVDMGQGLAIKVAQTAAYELSKVLPPSRRPLPVDLIRPADPSSFTLPHNSVTGGSATTHGACAAVAAACAELVSRLKPLADSLGEDFTWQQLIAKTVVMPGWRPIVNLSAAGEGCIVPVQPIPFIVPHAYTTFGAALAEAELDVLTGDRRVLSVDLLFDCGRSMNPGVDMGQVEGAFIFGMGMMLAEHVETDPGSGAVTSNSTWSYKVPGALCLPNTFNFSMLQDSPLAIQGPLGAKAVGEPPLLLSCSVAFALASAARAAAQQLQGKAPPAEQVLQLPALPVHLKTLAGTTPLTKVLQQQEQQVACA